MRLPWPFGRSTSDDGASSRSGGRRLRRARGAIASPPVRLASGAERRSRRPAPGGRCRRSSARPGRRPVVAPAAPFLADVPGHAAPAPDRDAARARVQRPRRRRASSSPIRGPCRASRPMRRSPAGPSSGMPMATSPPRRRSPDEADDDAPVVARSADPDGRRERPMPRADARPRGARVAAGPHASPRWRRPPTVTPAAQPLTRTAPALAPLPVTVSRSSSPSDAARGSQPADVALPIQASSRIPGGRRARRRPAPADAARAPLAPPRRFTELPAETPAAAVQRQAIRAPARRPGRAPADAAADRGPGAACRCDRGTRPRPDDASSGASMSQAGSPATPEPADAARRRPAPCPPGASPARPPGRPQARRRRPGVARPSTPAAPGHPGVPGPAGQQPPRALRRLPDPRRRPCPPSARGRSGPPSRRPRRRRPPDRRPGSPRRRHPSRRPSRPCRRGGARPTRCRRR